MPIYKNRRAGYAIKTDKPWPRLEKSKAWEKTDEKDSELRTRKNPRGIPVTERAMPVRKPEPVSAESSNQDGDAKGGDNADVQK